MAFLSVMVDRGLHVVLDLFSLLHVLDLCTI